MGTKNDSPRLDQALARRQQWVVNPRQLTRLGVGAHGTPSGFGPVGCIASTAAFTPMADRLRGEALARRRDGLRARGGALTRERRAALGARPTTRPPSTSRCRRRTGARRRRDSGHRSAGSRPRRSPCTQGIPVTTVAPHAARPRRRARPAGATTGDDGGGVPSAAST